MDRKIINNRARTSWKTYYERSNEHVALVHFQFMPAARCGIRLRVNYVERGERRGVARKANTARYLIDLDDRRQPRTFPQDVQNATVEWNSENT